MQQEEQQEKLEQEMLALLRKIANDVKKREAGRRAPTKRSMFSLQAATSADDLLRILEDTRPAVREFSLAANPKLDDQLRRAFALEGRFEQGELARNISRDAIRKEAERLLTMAVQGETDEEQAANLGNDL